MLEKRLKTKLVLLVLVVGLVYAFFAFNLHQYLTLDYVKSKQLAFESYYHDHKNVTIFFYFSVYVLVAALSLPGAAVMTLAGGALFGLWFGLLIVSFASTIGATLAFLAARFILRGVVQKKFKDKLSAINAGVEQDGAFYLFTLRLVPVFPFFVINLLMGLTPIRTLTFYLVSQIGMLAGTFVYVNAGTRIAGIESLKGILSPGLLISFALLGVFPIVAKKGMAVVKKRRSSRV
ncbi:TVP38/TMEM64 family protein [Thermodesulfobacteriota bacterium]